MRASPLTPPSPAAGAWPASPPRSPGPGPDPRLSRRVAPRRSAGLALSGPVEDILAAAELRRPLGLAVPSSVFSQSFQCPSIPRIPLDQSVRAARSAASSPARAANQAHSCEDLGWGESVGRQERQVAADFGGRVSGQGRFQPGAPDGRVTRPHALSGVEPRAGLGESARPDRQVLPAEPDPIVSWCEPRRGFEAVVHSVDREGLGVEPRQLHKYRGEVRRPARTLLEHQADVVEPALVAPEPPERPADPVARGRRPGRAGRPRGPARRPRTGHARSPTRPSARPPGRRRACPEGRAPRSLRPRPGAPRPVCTTRAGTAPHPGLAGTPPAGRAPAGSRRTGPKPGLDPPDRARPGTTRRRGPTPALRPPPRRRSRSRPTALVPASRTPPPDAGPPVARTDRPTPSPVFGPRTPRGGL